MTASTVSVPEAGSGGPQAEIARRLAREFGAPAGLLDPRGGRWVAHTGAPAEALPRLAPGLAVSAVSHGRAEVWHDDAPGGAVWLLLAVPGPTGPLLAALGFASATARATTPPLAWGPSCPEPALRAWGQSVSDRLAAERAGHVPEPGRESTAPNGLADPASADRRQVIGRLIRRLRISDPPSRFQQTVVNGLRSALGVSAVAWVPCHHAEPVVTIGEVGALQGQAFRALLPCHPSKGMTQVENEPQAPPDPGVRRVVSAASDSSGSVGWLYAFNPLDGREFTQADADLLQPIASLIVTHQVNARVYADLKDLLFGVIRALTAAIDAKDPYTSGHSERVARIAVRLAEEMGVSASQRGDLYLMGLLHDVGKIGVDDNVLKKPGPLTPDEYRQIQAHVEIGVHILTDLKKLGHLLPGVRHHHESLDGSGYPCGLSGEAIPFEARILAVADSYDAMSSTRPYRRRLTPSQIDEVLRKGSGTQWDPRIIDALFACRMDLEMIRQKGLGESLQLAVSGTLGRD